MLVLSPMCVLGGETVLKQISRWLKYISSHLSSLINNYVYVPLVLFVLIPYFLFNTGVIYSVTGDVPTSKSFSYTEFSYMFIDKQDMVAAEWLVENMKHPSNVYVGEYGYKLLSGYTSLAGARLIAIHPTNRYSVTENDYSFIRKANIVNDKVWTREAKMYYSYIPFSEMREVQVLKSKIYDNGTVIFK